MIVCDNNVVFEEGKEEEKLAGVKMPRNHTKK